MIRLRPYKSCDSKIIEKWVQDKEVFMKWGGDRFGEFPVSAQIIDDLKCSKQKHCHRYHCCACFGNHPVQIHLFFLLHNTDLS